MVNGALLLVGSSSLSRSAIIGIAAGGVALLVLLALVVVKVRLTFAPGLQSS